LIALKFRYKIIAITSSNPQSLEWKFNNMSWIAAIILCNIAGVGEVESSGDWAKGLRL
jgi:hypothetical protein